MSIQAVPHRPARRSRVRRSADIERSAQTRGCFVQVSAATDPSERVRILDDIVLLNLSIADRLAMRYSGRGVASDDLVQVARLGLVQAVRRFDLSTGSDFLSFAIPTILGELKRHFRDRGWTVRPPRRLQELRPSIVQATAALTQDLARTPTRAEVARTLGVDESAIVEALAADGCFTPNSLDRPVVGDSRRTVAWGDAMGHNDPNLDWVDVNLTLAPIFRKLSDRDRLVLQLRFVEDMTQQQIGSNVGLTQVQVSRILSRLVGLLKIELAG